MDIKPAQGSRIAEYGIALGTVIYAVWRGLVWFVVPGDFDRHHLRGR